MAAHTDHSLSEILGCGLQLDRIQRCCRRPGGSAGRWQGRGRTDGAAVGAAQVTALRAMAGVARSGVYPLRISMPL